MFWFLLFKTTFYAHLPGKVYEAEMLPIVNVTF